MPSITTWSRLEPNVRGASQNETLKARIYDPLWLLARQWQLGEMQGDDNGTPVSARVRAECAELTRYVPQGGAAQPVSFDPKKSPLEAFVEREAVHPEPARRYDELSEFLYDLRHPNRRLVDANRAPLMERNPLLFWKALSAVLAAALLFMFALQFGRFH